MMREPIVMGNTVVTTDGKVHNLNEYLCEMLHTPDETVTPYAGPERRVSAREASNPQHSARVFADALAVTQRTLELWTVYCPRGHVRTFDNYDDAMQWADYGHACSSVARHKFTRTVVSAPGVTE